MHSLPTWRVHPGLQGERLSSHMQVPRLKVRRDWFKGLRDDPIDHSHPDVGTQPDAETGDVRPQQVGSECICLKPLCLCFSMVLQLAGHSLQGVRVQSGSGTCWGLLGHASAGCALHSSKSSSSPVESQAACAMPLLQTVPCRALQHTGSAAGQQHPHSLSGAQQQEQEQQPEQLEDLEVAAREQLSMGPHPPAHRQRLQRSDAMKTQRADAGSSRRRLMVADEG